MPYIASMGIYVLKASAIKKLLREYFPNVSLGTQPSTAAACPYQGSHPCQHAALLPVSADVASALHQELEASSATLCLQTATCTILLEHLLPVGRQRLAQSSAGPKCLYPPDCLLLSQPAMTAAPSLAKNNSAPQLHALT